jgi:hypothetical protein
MEEQKQRDRNARSAMQPTRKARIPRLTLLKSLDYLAGRYHPLPKELNSPAKIRETFERLQRCNEAAMEEQKQRDRNARSAMQPTRKARIPRLTLLKSLYTRCRKSSTRRPRSARRLSGCSAVTRRRNPWMMTRGPCSRLSVGTSRNRQEAEGG